MKEKGGGGREERALSTGQRRLISVNLPSKD